MSKTLQIMRGQKIALFGAGNMGGAMFDGWLAAGIDGSDLVIVDPRPSSVLQDKVARAGAKLLVHPETAHGVAFVVLAVKPQIIDAVLPMARQFLTPESVAISVAAGKTLSSLAAGLGDCSTVRAMPNLPAVIGCGVTGGFPNASTTPRQREAADRLLSVLGPVAWVHKEADLDIVTALSGSGPAYVFHLVECMAEAARKLGLPAELAGSLARQTIIGSGAILAASSEEAQTLRRNVTSPGGTTEAALEVLMAKGGMQSLFDDALRAARSRSVTLSADSRGLPAWR